MSDCPGVLAQARHKVGTQRVAPAWLSPAVMMVLVWFSQWKNSSTKPPFQPRWEWKTEQVGALIHFQ